jgi:hypothetical protein
MAYSPHELKKTVLQGFSIATRKSGEETEPEMGLSDLMSRSL